MAQQATTLANQQTARGKQTAGNQQGDGTQRNTGSRYPAALVLVGAIIPIPMLAALLTVVAYILPPPLLVRMDIFGLGSNIVALLLGIIVTLIAWLLLALFCRPFATAKSGRLLSYEGIKTELEVLKARHEILKGAGTYATLTEQEIAGSIALAEIEKNICSIEQTLQSDGLEWVLSTGYISVWKSIYNAKEAMICLLPSTILIDDAKHDESRLQGSDIPDRDNLLTLLQNAINTLSPPPTQSLQQQPSPTQSLQQQPPQQTEAQARADIRKVSYVIHKFTSERWEGLLRTRNQLMGTASLAGIFTYVLLAIALLANIDQKQIEHIIVFYFLAAIVGLFGRLSTESNQTDAAVDDYGLTMSRVIVTPLLSGLAALVGVFLVPILFGLTPLTVTPGQKIPSISLSTIYDFTTANLVFAAIFGFVPNLVINVLQQKSEDVKSEIRSSSAAGTSTSGGSAGKGSRGTGGSGKNQVGTSTSQLTNLTSQLTNLTSQLTNLTGPLSGGTGSGQPGSSMTGLLGDGAGSGQPSGGTAGQPGGGADAGQPSP